MGTYEVRSIGGRLLLRSTDGEQAYRVAHRIADEVGLYVEVVYPGGHVAYVYPSNVLV